MSEAFETLKSIGVQKIYEDTHISRGDVEAILDKDYQLINQVQFLGFLSILQREYDLDLSSLRESALAYYKEEQITKSADHGVFVVAKKKKNATQTYLLVIIVIFLAAVILSFNFNSEDDTVEIQNVESQVIQDVKKEIINRDIIENNTPDENMTTLDTNVTVVETPVQEEIVEVKKEEKVADLQQFSIRAKSKVWIGYIDVETNKKSSKILKDKLTLNRDKEWILILGHSHVDIRANGENYKFSTKGQLRLLYKNGVVTKITETEFKKLNRGRKW